MSSTEWPSRSSPAVTTCVILTAKSNRPDGGHDALTCSDSPAEPQISAVRGGASLVRQPPFGLWPAPEHGRDLARRSRLSIMRFVSTTRPKAAAAARIGAALARRKRVELLELLRPCFARTEPWLQAAKYVAAVMSQIPKRNGWTIAAQAGDRAPDKTQRLLSRAVWDTSAAMAVA